MLKQVLVRMGRKSIEKCGFAAFDKTGQAKSSGSRQAKVGKEQVVGDDVLAVGQGDVVQGNALELLVGKSVRTGLSAASISVTSSLKWRAMSWPKPVEPVEG